MFADMRVAASEDRDLNNIYLVSELLVFFSVKMIADMRVAAAEDRDLNNI